MNISFSPHGHRTLINAGKTKNIVDSKKKDSAIDTLLKQKQDLEDSKNSTIKKALENKEDSKTLKEKLAEFDKKIEEIDKQISKVQMEENKKDSDDKEKSEATKNTSKAASQKAVQNGNSTGDLNNILNLSGMLKETSALVAQKVSMSSEIKTLDDDIKIDEGRGQNPVVAKNRVAKLEDNISNIYDEIGKNQSDINSNTNSGETSSVPKKDENKSVNSVNEDGNIDRTNAIVKQAIEHYNINNKDEAKKDNGEKVNATA